MREDKLRPIISNESTAHKNKPLMTQESISEVINSVVECEAVGCVAKATTNIAVKIGQARTILLQVCSNCVAKFQEETR